MTFLVESHEPDGIPSLVIKDGERIERIIVREDVRRQASLYTYRFSRTLRRDFNFTSICLFFACKKPNARGAIEDLLHCLTEEAMSLEKAATGYDMPPEPAFTTCSMRIISDEAQRLFDAIHTADHALIRILRRKLAELSEEEKTDPVAFKVAHRRIGACGNEMAAPFYQAYRLLRHKVSNDPMMRRPSARQIENEARSTFS